MKVNVIASGSKGNCTAVNCGSATILLDAGINFKRIQRALNFENPLACLITHEHQDHADKNTIAELLKRGVKVYMTAGTAQALNLEPRHNLIKLQLGANGTYNEEIIVEGQGLKKNNVDWEDINSWFYSDGVLLFTFPVKHDAAEPVSFNLVHDGESVMYLVDSGTAPTDEVIQAEFLLIEANHSEQDLISANIDDCQKQRVLKNHLSIEKAAEFINGCEKEFLKEVHLVHISRRHGNAQLFKDIVQNIVSVPVFAH